MVEILVQNQGISALNKEVLWDYFESYFTKVLKKPLEEPYTCVESIISTCKATKKFQPTAKLTNLLSLFIGKLPSLFNPSRDSSERLRISSLLSQALSLHPNLISSLLQTICIKHLSCSTSQILSFLTSLFHTSILPSVKISALLFIQRTFNSIVDLQTRTYLMSIHFVTFVCALADSNEQVKKIALLILDMYRNYESFNKVLKGYKAEKEVD